jgi:AcrR family transcriptional regulator
LFYWRTTFRVNYDHVMSHDPHLEPQWWTPRKAAVRRRALSREAIVAAAMKVLRSEGIDAMSMRRIATELDTGAASLYAHVAHKEELLELVFDEVVKEVPLPEVDAANWKEQAIRLWSDSHAAMARNGDIARVAIARVPVGPNAMLLSERMMTILRAGGVPEQAVAWSIDVVGLYVASNAIENALMRDKHKGVEPTAYYAQVGEYFANLPPALFPTTTALMPVLMTGDSEQRFRFGLELLVEGLASLAATSEGS